MARHRKPAPWAPGSTSDAAHAPGKRRLGLPMTPPGQPAAQAPRRGHDQPWIPTSGLVGRTRRSARRG